MRNNRIFILYALITLLFSACGEEAKKPESKAVKNPVGTYLDSRVNAMDMAKQSVQESNTRNKEREKAMESLLK